MDSLLDIIMLLMTVYLILFPCNWVWLFIKAQILRRSVNVKRSTVIKWTARESIWGYKTLWHISLVWNISLCLCLEWSTRSTLTTNLSFQQQPMGNSSCHFSPPFSPQPESVGGVQRNLALMPLAFQAVAHRLGICVHFICFISNSEGGYGECRD